MALPVSSAVFGWDQTWFHTGVNMIGRILRFWRYMFVIAGFVGGSFWLYVLTPPGQAFIAKIGGLGALHFAVLAVLVGIASVLWTAFATVVAPALLTAGVSLALAVLLCTTAMFFPVTETLVNSPWGTMVLIGVWIACEVAIFLPLPGGRLRRDVGPTTRKFTTSVAPEVVWKRLYPVPGELDAYLYRGAKLSSPPDGIKADFLISYLFTRVPEGRVENIIRVLEFQPGHAAKMILCDPETAQPLEITDFQLTPLADGGTEVTSNIIVSNAWPGLRILCWLSGFRADSQAFLKARIERRHDWSITGRSFPQWTEVQNL
jgi:hypothetical protein